MHPNRTTAAIDFFGALQVITALYQSKAEPLDTVQICESDLLDPGSKQVRIHYAPQPDFFKTLSTLETQLRHSHTTQHELEWLKRDPAIAAMIQARYIPPQPELQALLQLPPNSLGYAYAQCYVGEGSLPKYTHEVESLDDASYVALRLDETHDIWHLITGFPATSMGEFGLKAFEMAQVHRPLATIVVTSGLLNTIFRYPENMDWLLHLILHGYQAGLQAKPLFAQKWEEHWERSLEDWRSELAIEPVPSALMQPHTNRTEEISRKEHTTQDP